MRARLAQKAYRATPEYQAEYQATMKRKRFDKRLGQGTRKKPTNASDACKTGGLLPDVAVAAAEPSPVSSDSGSEVAIEAPWAHYPATGLVARSRPILPPLFKDNQGRSAGSTWAHGQLKKRARGGRKGSWGRPGVFSCYFARWGSWTRIPKALFKCLFSGTIGATGPPSLVNEDGFVCRSLDSQTKLRKILGIFARYANLDNRICDNHPFVFVERSTNSRRDINVMQKDAPDLGVHLGAREIAICVGLSIQRTPPRGPPRAQKSVRGAPAAATIIVGLEVVENKQRAGSMLRQHKYSSSLVQKHD
jgi:hypothetical protein